MSCPCEACKKKIPEVSAPAEQLVHDDANSFRQRIIADLNTNRIIAQDGAGLINRVEHLTSVRASTNKDSQ